MGTRYVGKMGELEFQQWCSQVGLVVNKSGNDETGWDSLVEFPLGTIAQDPTSVHKAAFECKVQVKATDSKNNRITLSNLRRLVTSPLPAFILFLEYDGLNAAQNAFVVHVDRELSTKVLKRVWEFEQSGEERKLNHKTMTVPYDESHSMEQLDGKCLGQILQGYIGDDVAEYIQRKKRFLESEGFDEGGVEIQFDVEASADGALVWVCAS